jgi:pSer/pThr/pTyr-binding forkhead associated (FHA) protein
MSTPRPRPSQDTVRRPGPARLMVFQGDAVHRVVELGPRGLSIGRGAQNDLVLDDPDRTISRFHAEVRLEAGRWVLLDLNSQNGTWVETRRVDRVELRSGVPVRVGPFRLVFDDTPLMGD